ncbi:unnamed protein product [Hymenolepis diminuta]|uniref:Uncharacterized protein n=1 Tax=Hymenolepis diminuta TaxID=6216 RepID=A0A0R3SWW9_HYMDI|nr:unnamed protein product [Hymenolepis diminuta]
MCRNNHEFRKICIQSLKDKVPITIWFSKRPIEVPHFHFDLQSSCYAEIRLRLLFFLRSEPDVKSSRICCRTVNRNGVHSQDTAFAEDVTIGQSALSEDVAARIVTKVVTMKTSAENLLRAVQLLLFNSRYQIFPGFGNN